MRRTVQRARLPRPAPPAPPSASGPPPADARPPARLAWLDLLRGIAALMVALHHATYYYTPRWRAGLVGWFDPGTYGVLVFFLVSGYIIPASLERHGQVHRFWIGRLLRIYPLLTTACAITLLPYVLGIRGLRAGLEDYRPATAVLAHLTMLQDVLSVPNMINVLWTLSYEMLFYLLVVALFVTRTHRLSAPIALALAIAAVAAGGLLPMAALSRAAGIGPVVALTALTMAMAIIAAASARPAVRTAGGVIGGVLAVALVVLNGRIGPWQSLIILAVMFTGTAVYRAEHRQISRRTATLTSIAVPVGAVVAGAAHAGVTMTPEQADAFAVSWAGSVVLAALTFAAAWAARRQRIPAWLTGLGTISFSLYLLHPVLLMLSDQIGGTPDHDDVVRLALFTGVLVMVSTVTHRYIEAPFQRLGRRLGAGRPSVRAAPVGSHADSGP